VSIGDTSTVEVRLDSVISDIVSCGRLSRKLVLCIALAIYEVSLASFTGRTFSLFPPPMRPGNLAKLLKA